MTAEAFWADPDVRWLTGVNTSAGTVYFNKEQFEELLSWMQLPALLEIARHDTVKPSSINKIELAVSRACSVAEEAGYRLDKYLEISRGVLKGAQSLSPIETHHK